MCSYLFEEVILFLSNIHTLVRWIYPMAVYVGQGWDRHMACMGHSVCVESEDRIQLSGPSFHYVVLGI